MSPAVEPDVPVCLIKAVSLLLNENRIALRRATPLPRHWITAVNARAAESGAARFVVFAAGDDVFHAIPPPLAVALFDHLLSPPSTDVARIWPLIRELSPSAASFELEAEFVLTATLCAAIEVTYLPRFTKDELVERLERIVTRCTELADALDWIDEYCAMPNAELWRSEIGGHLSQHGVSLNSIELFVRHSPTLPRLLEFLKWNVRDRINAALESPQVRASRSDASVTRFRELVLGHLLVRFPTGGHLDLATVAHGLTIAAFWDNPDPKPPNRPNAPPDPLSFRITLDAARIQLRRMLAPGGAEMPGGRRHPEPM